MKKDQMNLKICYCFAKQNERLVFSLNDGTRYRYI